MSTWTQKALPIRKIVLLEPGAFTTSAYSGVHTMGQGIAILGTILAQKGYDVGVCVEELAPYDWSEIAGAELVGISILTATAPRGYELADRLRHVGTPVVIGGCHATVLPDEALDHADFVVRGEGEDTLPELVRALRTKGDLSRVKGLSFRADGIKVHNADRPLEHNLDRFPVPDFSLVKGMRRNGVVSIMTRRGCPFNCSFCCVGAINGHTVREHSVERVLYEIEKQMYWIGDWGVLFFSDDIFNLKPERAKRILRSMLERNLTPAWIAQVRHEASRDPELLRLMRLTNCARVFVGFESVNPRTLDQYGKKESVTDIARAVRAFHDAGIKVHGMFILGSDEDTIETVEETLEFVRAHDIDSIQINYLTPLPGSRDFREIQSKPKVLLNAPWNFYDGNHVVHVPKRIPPALLQTSVNRIMVGFYSLKSVARRLFRGDVREAVIRLHGRRLIRRGARERRAYVRWLENARGAPPVQDRAVFGKRGRPVGFNRRKTPHGSRLTRFRAWAAERFAFGPARFSRLPEGFSGKRTRGIVLSRRPAHFRSRHKRIV